MLPLSVAVRRALLICSTVAAAPAMAITLTLTELPVPDGYGTAGVANLAADGTVVGMVWPDAKVVRWVPGADPEVLGGGETFTLENIMPLVSKDGSLIATAGYFQQDGTDVPRESPEIWMGGTDWLELPDLTLGDSSPYGMSYDGQTLVGGSFPPAGDASGIQQYPWIWTASGGQVALGMIDGTVWGQAWAVSNDSHVAVGFFEAGPGDFTRYGVRWVDGAPEWILDADGQHVGQAINCNSDCSVIVGAGRDADSPQAWRWTAAGGVEYLGTIFGEDPGAVYYAFESSEDGKSIVGSAYTIDPNLGGVNHGFLWTQVDHMQDFVSFLSLYGIDYGGDFNDMVVNAITPDGKTMLVAGQGSDFSRQRAVVHVVPDDAIFADGFDVIPI
ncbi:MAG TPA: hypothetical protein VKB52_09660 [Rhodanobacteraceae bacterium]|nr:hypothetical protein [Rhodanobacteraceae bacterium]